jgi:hypothetical protein
LARVLRLVVRVWVGTAAAAADTLAETVAVVAVEWARALGFSPIVEVLESLLESAGAVLLCLRPREELLDSWTSL